MESPIITNPDGTLRKHVKNKTIVFDPKNLEIRTYTRSNITNETGAPKVKSFTNRNTAELKFKFAR